jgi:hypothetical protein
MLGLYEQSSYNPPHERTISTICLTGDFIGEEYLVGLSVSSAPMITPAINTIEVVMNVPPSYT